MPTPVPASKLFISLLARDKSATFVCNSLLTVASSSLTDCNSSFEVSSSSLVDCNSSLTDCISSLEDFSSSLELSSSSCVVCKYSSLARSSCLSPSISNSASTSINFSGFLSFESFNCALSTTGFRSSSKMIKYRLVSKFESTVVTFFVFTVFTAVVMLTSLVLAPLVFTPL